MIIWLVVFRLPLWKIMEWVRQLGWMDITEWKVIIHSCSSHHQPASLYILWSTSNKMGTPGSVHPIGKNWPFKNRVGRKIQELFKFRWFSQPPTDDWRENTKKWPCWWPVGPWKNLPVPLFSRHFSVQPGFFRAFQAPDLIDLEVNSVEGWYPHCFVDEIMTYTFQSLPILESSCAIKIWLHCPWKMKERLSSNPLLLEG